MDNSISALPVVWLIIIIALLSSSPSILVVVDSFPLLSDIFFGRPYNKNRLSLFLFGTQRDEPGAGPAAGGDKDESLLLVGTPRQQKSNVCILESDQFPEVTKQLATSLSLDICSEQDIIVLWQRQQHQEQIAMATTTDDDSTPISIITHVLSVDPYYYHKGKKEEDDDLVDDSYAVGIRCINNDQKTSSRKQRQRWTTTTNNKPFVVDFCPPTNSHLGRRLEGKKNEHGDLLLQAIGLRGRGSSSKRRRNRPTTNTTTNATTDEHPPASGKVYYDLTAGWGRDALIIAQQASNAHHHKKNAVVHMVERNPIVACVLDDALRRLKLVQQQQQESVNSISYPQLSLEKADGRTVLEQFLLHSKDGKKQQSPDVIYLDPMFPIRKKSASVKKDMQILHSLLQLQSSSQEQQKSSQGGLLRLALQVAKERVVVKRPIHAPWLDNDCQPSYSVKGSTNRWDVYLT